VAGSANLPSGLIIVAVAAAILAVGMPGRAAVADPARIAQARNEAPVGHRQPRVQDLPANVQHDEDKASAEQDALDRKLQNSICRGC
jgi:hypothetical protein